MKKILGLDLGTTSIGWALVNEKENDNEQSSIIKLGVRVNPLSVDEQSNFEKGKAIMTASSFTRCLIVILKGSASVSKIGADGRRTVINILRCGDIFGMATLFFEQDFPSEIIAEEPCRLAIFPKELVEEAFAASPEFAKAYVTLLSQKIHFLNSRLSTFTEGETSERFLRWLSAVSGGKTEFCLPCSISRAAETIGVGRASLYRAIGVLSEEKVLKHEGKNIVILKPERLLK